MVSFTADCISLVRKSHRSHPEGLNIIMGMVRSLILGGDCIDKGVITAIMELGMICAGACVFGGIINSSLDTPEFVIEMSAAMILQEGKSPSDTRTAFAIREGLIGLCMGFIEFNMHSSYKFGKYIEDIFKAVHAVSLHQKTAKAIRSKKKSIEVLLKRNGSKEQGLAQALAGITNVNDNNRLLDMVRSIININGSYCCRCNKSLSKTEVLQCNGCGSMTYCSRACQKEDWSTGHNLTCCAQFTDEKAGQFQGRVVPRVVPNDERAANKLKELEINCNMIHLKLFFDRSETILNQAKSLGIPLYDCIAMFDLRQCPLTVEVVNYTDFYDSFEKQMKGFEDSRSKDNIMCVYYSQIYNGKSEKVPRLAMQRFFPHKWLRNKANRHMT